MHRNKPITISFFRKFPNMANYMIFTCLFFYKVQLINCSSSSSSSIPIDQSQIRPTKQSRINDDFRPTEVSNRNSRLGIDSNRINSNSNQNLSPKLTQKLICFKNNDITIESSDTVLDLNLKIKNINSGMLSWQKNDDDLTSKGVGFAINNNAFTQIQQNHPDLSEKFKLFESTPTKLTIKNCDFSDAGVYTVKVILVNPAEGMRNTEKYIEIMVLQKPGKPIVRQAPDWLDLGYLLESKPSQANGQNSQIQEIARCQTTSKPKAKHTWILNINGTLLRTIPGEMSSNLDQISGVSTDISILKLVPNRQYLGYRFICQVNYDLTGSKYREYSVPEVDSKNVQLQNKIEIPLDVQYQPDDPVLVVNDTNIMCKSRARPAPQYKIRLIDPEGSSKFDMEFSKKNYFSKESSWIEELQRFDRKFIAKLTKENQNSENGPDPNFKITQDMLSQIECQVKNSHGTKKISKSINEVFTVSQSGFWLNLSDSFSTIFEKVNSNKPVGYGIIGGVLLIIILLILICCYCKKKRSPDDELYDDPNSQYNNGTMKTTDANSDFFKFRKNSGNSEPHNKKLRNFFV